MDQKTLDAKLQGVGVSDETIRAGIVKYFDCSNLSEAKLDALLTPRVVGELISLAKCYSHEGFRQSVADSVSIGEAFAKLSA